MTEMFGEAWSPMSVPDLAPDDDDDDDEVSDYDGGNHHEESDDGAGQTMELKPKCRLSILGC